MTGTDDLAARIHAMEFDHPFTLHPDGTITEPSGVYAPDVYHDPDTDVMIDGGGWSTMTGLSGQDRYHGAVMHASEYIGRGVASAMLALAEDEPVTFAVVLVYDPEADTDAGEDDVAGWAIVYRTPEPDPCCLLYRELHLIDHEHGCPRRAREGSKP